VSILFAITDTLGADAMADLSDFERKPRHKETHPTGWEPSLSWNGKDGTITAQLDTEPDESVWAELIADWGLDPSRTMVVDGSLQIRAWDSSRNGELVRMKYYRATIKPRETTVDRADVEQLCKLIEKKKPSQEITKIGNSAFLVLLSDWQLGKSENGGSEATTKRIVDAIDKAVHRYLELQKCKRGVSDVYLIGLGDLVESCDGFYAMQTFQTDLTDREQDKIARRLVMYAIDSFVDVGAKIIAMGVPGNHGENRKNGKAYTDWLDNRDFATFETVAEIISVNPERYKNVSIPTGAINSDDLTMTLDLKGIPVSFAHGHQFRSGTNSQAKMETWWKGQALGRTEVADAEILCCGHFHHFVLSEGTGRTVLQVPAMDGGSKWFTSTSGSSAPAGMVTMCVGAGVGIRGWSDLLIL